MSNQSSLIQVAALRYASLAAAVAGALGSSAQSFAVSEAQDRLRNIAPTVSPTLPEAPHLVTTCDDDANADMPGSLRYEVLHATNNETIDLTPLKFVCSKITLSSAIDVPQDSLIFQGPGSKYLTIDGDHYSRAFKHSGSGTLVVDELTIANGYYVDSTKPYGGCIYSYGSVSLLRSIVSNCTASSASSTVAARGGGVHARGVVTLNGSEISKNKAIAHYGARASGGGVSVGDISTSGSILQVNYSTISENIADASGQYSSGGGLYILRGDAHIAYSTISGNGAGVAAGGLSIQAVAPRVVTIVESTISGNTATRTAGVYSGAPIAIDNSTIAFNLSGSSYAGNGVYATAPMVLHSSIVANNFNIFGGISDIGGGASATVTGSNNLVTSSTLPLPMWTITACPQLEPLLDNGGPTPTHLLAHTSPAIDQGAPGNSTKDQRLQPRVSGFAADIGAVERQPGEIDERVFANGFDGLICDQ